LALDNGFLSAFALPLRLRDSTLGALNLFFVGPDPMSEPDVIVAQAVADLATISLLHHRRAVEARLMNEQLSIALNSRIVIEQAKGVISERVGVDLAEAFAMLRRYARSNNIRLTDVAQGTVDGTLEASVWTRVSRSSEL
jgi:GAF domain-containing protein